MRFSLLVPSALLVLVGAWACVSDDGANQGRDAGLDGATSSGSTDGAAQGDTAPSSDAPSDGPIDLKPVAGDVVNLYENTLKVSSDNVTSWDDIEGRLKFSPGVGPAPKAFTLGGTARTCAKFGVASATLIAQAPSVSFTGDFSVTLKLVRGTYFDNRDDGAVPFAKALIDAKDTYNYTGFALLSDYQLQDGSTRSRQFAGRFDFVRGVQAVDLVEPITRPSEEDHVHVVTFAKRGSGAIILVRDVASPDINVTTATSGFALVTAPSDAPMTIGSARTNENDSTKFDGLVCAVVVHVGAESTDDLKTRIGKLAQ